MKRLFLTILALSLAFATYGADTYESFVSKKGIKSAGECMRIYKDGSKYWMEFPDSLMGRRVILSSFMRSSSGWTTCGTDISSREVFTLSQTDSLLLLTSPIVNAEATAAPVRWTGPVQADAKLVLARPQPLAGPESQVAPGIRSGRVRFPIRG